METVTKTTAIRYLDGIEKKLDNLFGDDFSVSIDKKAYTPTSISFKVTYYLNTEGGEELISPNQSEYKKYRKAKLNKDDTYILPKLGETFEVSGKNYRFTDWKPNNRKYHFILTCLHDRKSYKFSEELVLDSYKKHLKKTLKVVEEQIDFS